MRKKIAVVLILVAIILFCGKITKVFGTNEISVPEVITINKTSATIEVGEELKLEVSTNEDVTWKSSNSEIATVDSNGKVKGIKQGTTTITATVGEEELTCTVTVEAKEEWTDFSKAKVELKKEGISDAIVQISNVTVIDGHYYYIYITNSKDDKPTLDNNINDEKIDLEYIKKDKVLKSFQVSKYVEKNQDLYLWVVEKNPENYSGNNQKIVLSAKKLTRFAEGKYSDAFFATFMAKLTDSNNAPTLEDVNNQIITTFIHSKENDRKMQIKIGKITDTSILRKIMNKDSSGFSELLSFAKSNKGIYDKTVQADKNSGNISFIRGKGEENTENAIDLKLDNNAYYYLYVKTDDEGGKYFSNEGLTLALSSSQTIGTWSLFFYGNDNFKWNIEEPKTTKDITTAKGKIPQTGESAIVLSIVGIAVVIGAVSIYKYRRNNF